MTCTTVPEVTVVATEPEATVCVLYTMALVVGTMIWMTLPEVIVVDTEPDVVVRVVYNVLEPLVGIITTTLPEDVNVVAIDPEVRVVIGETLDAVLDVKVDALLVTWTVVTAALPEVEMEVLVVLVTDAQT